MRLNLKGAFTVDAPRKRLRMWTGVPIIFAAQTISYALTKTKAEDLVLADHPMQSAGLSNAATLAIGAGLCVHPYTRWAGALVLTWGILGFSIGTAINRLPQAKQAIQESRGIQTAGAPIKILRG